LSTGARTPQFPAEQNARRELAALLAGARDLDGDYDSSVELATHLQAQRVQAGQPTDTDSVVLDAGGLPAVHIAATR
jgi:hypothetical protein